MTRHILWRMRVCAIMAFAAIAAVLVCSPTAQAQATATASKKLDISAFAGYSYLKPDYGPAHDNGFTFGANITRAFHFPVKPSLEARVSLNHGSTVNEKTYLFGVRGQTNYGRFHPYADFLIGVGDIHYNFVVNAANPTAYLNDNSLVKSPGGGVDIDLIRNFRVKADYQYQFWYLGTNDSLNPSAITLGISYSLPSKPNYQSVVH
ncbi:outer membrane beta-barrel protein [Bryocella elongata]|nr:outer membrane beta-barrel protein [Bryocella elongata]